MENRIEKIEKFLSTFVDELEQVSKKANVYFLVKGMVANLRALLVYDKE